MPESSVFLRRSADSTIHQSHLCLIHCLIHCLIQDPGLPSRWGQWFETAGQVEHSDWQHFRQIFRFHQKSTRNPARWMGLRSKASLRAIANASCSNGARHAFGGHLGLFGDSQWTVWIPIYSCLFHIHSIHSSVSYIFLGQVSSLWERTRRGPSPDMAGSRSKPRWFRGRICSPPSRAMKSLAQGPFFLSLD